MNMSDIISLISVVVAAVALLNSWRAGRQAHKATREANELVKQQVALQDRLAQIEQSREHARLMQTLQAALRAELRQTGQSSWRLFVLNTGSSPARNVTIMLDGKPLLEHDAVPRGEQEANLIGPESDVSYCIAPGSDCSPPFELEATWDDDSGQQGQYGTTLTF